MEWTNDCEDAFEFLKKTLASPLVLTTPLPGETLYMYISITKEVVSAILVRESNFIQSLVYLISKPIAESETRYQKIKKISLCISDSIMKAQKVLPRTFHSVLDIFIHEAGDLPTRPGRAFYEVVHRIL